MLKPVIGKGIFKLLSSLKREIYGGSYEVYNSVWESTGVSHEALGIATGGGTGQTGGYWSPDTAGHFSQLPY